MDADAMTLIEAAFSAESRAESRSATKTKAKKSSRPSQTKQTLLSGGNTLQTKKLNANLLFP